MNINTRLMTDILEYHREDLYDIIHSSTRPSNMKLYMNGYIFDEDRSVKWNKEQIKIKNAEYEAEQKRLEEKKAKAIQEICNDMAKDILDYYYEDNLELTLPEIQLATNHAVNTKGIWEIDDIFSYVIEYLKILIEYKKLLAKEENK